MIQNLKQDAIIDFLGKRTTANLSAQPPGTLLVANNLLILEDGKLRRMPGYTLVEKVGTGPTKAVFDFQRNVDQKQFLIIQSGDSIYAMNADGTGLQTLSTGETGTHQFVQNAFAAYSSDGHNAWRYVDVAGTLTKYKWGIDPPATAPTLAIEAGSLTLTYGRTYVYCYVSKYTDSLGIQRLSIGAPSPASAYSGPVTNSAITLSNLAASADPQVNYIWVFEVSDSPQGTSATYYFAAEVANGTTSWADTLPDSALDQTRLAPFDNHPAPPAPMLDTFQNRVAAMNGNVLQLSGYSEITLGIPEESWPTSLFFDLPSGKRTATSLATLQQGTMLVVSTEDYWYAYTGYDAATFTEQDRVASPGAAGPLALCMTTFGLAYLSKSRRIWLWNGSDNPTDISSGIAMLLPGSYTMEDLDPATVETAVLRWYEYGRYALLCVFAKTSGNANQTFDLIQVWSFAVESQASSGIYGTGSKMYGQLRNVAQTDKIPANQFTAAGNVLSGDTPYLYCGDAVGNVYRFPDGFQDAGANYQSNGQLSWMLPNEGKSRFFWADITTDRGDSALSFGVSASVADAPDQEQAPIGLTVQQLPSPVGQSSLVIRASMNAASVATGKYASLFLSFPNDDADAAISKIILASRPLNAGIA